MESRRGWFRREIRGLKDPLAPDPRQIVETSGLDPDKIELEFEPYWSLSPTLVENGARRLLAAPDEVEFRYEPTTLTLTAIGRAPYDWIEAAKQFPAGQARVNAIETSQVKIAEAETLQDLGRQIEQQTLRFQDDISVLDASETASFEKLFELLREATQLAAKIRQPLVVYVLGQASPRGTYANNLRLSQARADSIVRRLTAAGIPNDVFVSEGIATRQQAEQSDQQKPQVSFRVEIGPPDIDQP